MSTDRAGRAQELKAVNLRVREDTRALIDKAATIQGRSRTDFMIEAARRAAEEAILDQRVIMVDQESYDRFLAALDRAPESNDKLRKLMHTKAPWDQ
ncbi:CopG family transcriptional regulator [Novosphingobium sp. FSW06-99]|nr:CopG family transcriptional regulator [Novosphingobium sp. FSW06-99]